MSEGEPQAQATAQAGSSGEAEDVGFAVGVLHSSEEAPVMGVEPRRDARLGVRGGRGGWPARDKPLRRKVTYPACRCASKWRDGTRPGKPDTGNPFVRFDEERSGSAELTTTVGLIRLLPLRLLYPKRVVSNNVLAFGGGEDINGAGVMVR